jgi:hypothetical protein
VKRADALGYQNVLLPSGWIAGQDALTFAAAMAPQTRQINQLVALRMGEVWPPMLARAIATVDHIAKGPPVHQYHLLRHAGNEGKQRSALPSQQRDHPDPAGHVEDRRSVRVEGRVLQHRAADHRPRARPTSRTAAR